MASREATGGSVAPGAGMATGSRDPTTAAPVRRRTVMLRVAAYLAAAVLVISLIGLAAQPAGAGVSITLWSLVLVSGAILLGIVLTAHSGAERMEREYDDSIQNLTEKFARLSTRDWLTGLLTPAEFREAARLEISRWRRYGRPVSLAVIAPDPASVELINRREGADGALARFMSEAISSELRETDTLGRRDGSIAIWALLRETDRAGSAVAAARIRARFERMMLTLPDGEQIALPVRVGMVTYPDDGADAAELLEKLPRLAA